MDPTFGNPMAGNPLLGNLQSYGNPLGLYYNQGTNTYATPYGQAYGTGQGFAPIGGANQFWGDFLSYLKQQVPGMSGFLSNLQGGSNMPGQQFNAQTPTTGATQAAQAGNPQAAFAGQAASDPRNWSQNQPSGGQPISAMSTPQPPAWTQAQNPVQAANMWSDDRNRAVYGTPNQWGMAATYGFPMYNDPRVQQDFAANTFGISPQQFSQMSANPWASGYTPPTSYGSGGTG